MKICPQCGYNVDDKTLRCPRCNKILFELHGCTGNCLKCKKKVQCK